VEILAKYNSQQTFYFPLIDFGETDFESTPVTFASGDTQISIDGGAFANTTNNPAHEGNGIYSLVLTAAETQGTRIVVTIIDQTSTKAWEDQAIVIHNGLTGMLYGSDGIIVCQVDDTSTAPSTTAFEANRLAPNLTEEATASHMIGTIIKFVTGSAVGEVTDVTAYSLQNSREFYTVTALVTTPANGDIFIAV
jgi:hypothetical protein